MAESNSAAGFAHVSSIEAVTEIPADPLNSFFDKEAGYIGSEQRNQLFTSAITFEGLTIRDDKVDISAQLTPETAPTVATIVLGPLAKYIGLGYKAPKSLDRTRYRSAAVNNVTGYFLPKTCTLIIGPTGSGKTTLMRTLAGISDGRAIIDGVVKLDGKVATENIFAKFATFSQQTDLTLAPVLTVDETFTHAAECLFSQNYIEGHDGSSREVVAATLQLFGLSHVANTVVGNAELRGLSGGQKRRVTVAEKAFGDYRAFYYFDEPTNGLDAQSALMIGENSKRVCQFFGSAAIMVLLQPSIELYNVFDYILVMTQGGHQAYFGPRSEAVNYFERMGLKKPETLPEPDFLQQVTTTPEKFQAKGQDTVFDEDYFDAAWKLSDECKRVKNDIARINSGTKSMIFDEGNPKHVTIHSTRIADMDAETFDELSAHPYARPFRTQVMLNIKRQLKLIMRNPNTLSRVINAFIFGIVLGTVFWQVDSNDFVLRAGCLFTLLYMGFLSACIVPLPEFMADRLCFYSQRERYFYDSSAYYMAVAIMHFPLSFIETTLLSVLSYFLAGLSTADGAANFFYFYVMMIAMSYYGLALARFLAYTMPSTSVGSVACSGVLASFNNVDPNGCYIRIYFPSIPAIALLFAITSGFSPPYNTIIWPLRWISWVNPMAYAFEGYIVNEFRDGTITVQGNTVDGLQVTEAAFNIPRYPFDSYGALNTPVKVMIFDLGMVVFFAILVDLVGMYVIDAFRRWYGPTSRRHVEEIRQRKEREDLVAKLVQRAKKRRSKAKLASTNDTMEPDTDSGANEQREQNTNTQPDISSNGPDDMNGASMNGGEPENGHAIGKKPNNSAATKRVHLTIKDIVYEVDVPIKKDEKVEAKKASIVEQEDSHEAQTNATFGQRGRGVAQNALLRANGLELGGSQELTQVVVPETGALEEGLPTEEAGARAAVTMEEEPTAPAQEDTPLPPSEPGRLRLLSGVTAEFAPGSMTALMGESGAGKTTLLDVVAGYKTGGHITGSIRINGKEKDERTWKSLAAYCEQSDIHSAKLSVRESIRFAANMRMGADVPPAEKSKEVEDIIDLLELRSFADMIVGEEAAGTGLPKHARKRLTMAVELASRPAILFLDEPTSGLDALSATIVIGVVRKVADEAGVVVVCTIHQPSRLIFETFDNLLLLQRGGRCVYFGPIGPESKDIDKYITAINPEYALPEGRNPADHILDVFMGHPDVNFVDLYKKSAFANNACQIASKEADPNEARVKERAPLPAYAQTLYIFFRQVRCFWRSPENMGLRLLWAIFASLLLGLVYWRQDDTVQGANNRIGALFFMLTAAQVPMLDAAIPLIEGRAVFYREVFSGTYNHIPYAIAYELAEMTFNIPYALVYFLISYWMVNFNPAAGPTIITLLFLFLAYILLPSTGQAVAYLSPNVGTANGMITLMLVIQTLTMGFLIYPQNIPWPWKAFYWVNPFRYLLQGMAVNDLHDQQFTNVDPYTGVTSTITGDQILSERTWSYDQLWWYCFVAILLMIAFFEVVKLLACRYVCFLKR